MTCARTLAVHRAAGDGGGPRVIRHCPRRWHRGGAHLIAMLGAACIVLFATDANPQCTARHVLRNHLTLRKAPTAIVPPTPIKSAVTVPVWKTITIGTFANSFALLNALDAAGCAIGDSAQQVLARPAFTVSAAKASVELVAM